CAGQNYSGNWLNWYFDIW
nr:immunoglobulin heavy chain junction region [Macaca mulatta]MPN70970.1 immunoglobulin heavy chain junction region [Macaca mulatta]MPN71037.1 immunoglobulin heavy chain junction region [Macaca mulatta]MPN72588.1 immunoglobulin heavy chain junction region [Macaca mulatta]MPN72794.1 immunoglobulin heavy chain junction region [Macaca mulatta]